MRKNRRGDMGSYVYRHIRHDKNEVFYVGVGTGYNYQRSVSKTSRGRQWKYITAKTTYSVEIILDRLTLEEANKKEIEFIKLYGLKRDGGTLVNHTYGGEGHLGLSGILSPNYGKKYSPERVEKMRQAVLASITPETRAKVSESAKRRLPLSEEGRRKISNALKSRIWTEEMRRKSGIRLNKAPRKPITEKTRLKMSESQKGKYVSNETRGKTRAANLQFYKRKAELHLFLDAVYGIPSGTR